MRLAYADPPYPNQARRHYGDHPDFGGEVDHAELTERLDRDYDGWALSTSMTALRDLLPLCPKGVVVASWHVTNARPGGAQHWWHHYSWEPVILAPARRRDDTRNVLSCPNEAVFKAAGITGAKPRQFCEWIFRLLGAVPDDQLDDLFPGSGAVGRAWAAWRCQTTIPLGPMRPGERERATAIAATGPLLGAGPPV